MSEESRSRDHASVLEARVQPPAPIQQVRGSPATVTPSFAMADPSEAIGRPKRPTARSRYQPSRPFRRTLASTGLANPPRPSSLPRRALRATGCLGIAGLTRPVGSAYLGGVQ